MDYESPFAHRVARDIWSALSRKALDSGFAGITARWMSPQQREGASGHENPLACIFVIGPDRPETVDRIGAFSGPEAPRLYGVVVATPERPSPLSGSLLYQGVGRLTGAGIRAGAILPALVPVSPKTEGEAYVAQLIEYLRKARGRR